MSLRFPATLGLALSAALAALLPSPSVAHGATAGDLPLATVTLRLQHRKPADIVALLARERMPAGASTPRSARAGNEGALLPEGIDAVLRSGDDTLTLVGAANRFASLEDCIQVIDTPVERAGENVRVTLTLQKSSARDLRLHVLRLPGSASVQVRGQQMTLEGKPAWLHQALRQVIREELGLRERSLPLTP